MGIWEKWLVKKIAKQALKENQDTVKAARVVFERIHKDLLPLYANDKRTSRIHEYMFDTWRALINEEFPLKKIKERTTKVFKEKAEKIYEKN